MSEADNESSWQDQGRKYGGTGTHAVPEGTIPMTAAEYEQFTDNLRRRLEGDARVLGLVALGSTANPEWRDAHSDHDFWVVVAPGATATFLEKFSWLPDAGDLVACVRTGVRYMVALYATGHVLEIGVFEPDELTEGKLGAYQVLFDRHGLAERLAEIAARPVRPPTPDDRSECELLFVMLLTGAARAARRERLSAHKYLGFFAPDFLIGLLVRNKPFAMPERVDRLDPWRRFEELDPALSADMLAAVRLPPTEAALRLLDIAERELRDQLRDFPARAAAVVRAALQHLCLEPRPADSTGIAPELANGSPGEAADPHSCIMNIHQTGQALP
jgi:hypothetical protein